MKRGTSYHYMCLTFILTFPVSPRFWEGNIKFATRERSQKYPRRREKNETKNMSNNITINLFLSSSQEQ